MAGYSGGRKGVCPGVLGAPSIVHFHSAGILNHPNARTGCVVENPVNDLAEQMAALAPPHFLANASIDRGRRVTGIYAGDWQEAWRAGVADVAAATGAASAGLADVVITSSAGYPLDTTVYQAIKGVVAAEPVVKPGGTVILVASLAEGIGSEEFEAQFRRYSDAPGFLQAITETDHVAIDQWQLQMLARVATRAEVLIYSDGVDPQVLEGTMVRPICSVEEELASIRRRRGGECSIVCIPEGPYVIAEPAPPTA
jgi:nickel-dependent lactate racemase